MEIELQDANTRLKTLASTDFLTGIANRRSFDLAIEQESRRSNRSGAPLSVLLIDIDKFKAYNDYFGHSRGDECLRQVAQALNRCTKRPGDLAARYGGEEFSLILPDTDEAGAETVAELRARKSRRSSWNIRKASLASSPQHRRSLVCPRQQNGARAARPGSRYGALSRQGIGPQSRRGIFKPFGDATKVGLAPSPPGKSCRTPAIWHPARPGAEPSNFT